MDLGLKSDDTFKVEARFDLVLPDEALETYGLRLSDVSPLGGGDDFVDVMVRKLADGSLAVLLREAMVVGQPPVMLATIPLAAAEDDNQIILRLEHAGQHRRHQGVVRPAERQRRNRDLQLRRHRRPHLRQRELDAAAGLQLRDPYAAERQVRHPERRRRRRMALRPQQRRRQRSGSRARRACHRHLHRHGEGPARRLRHRDRHGRRCRQQRRAVHQQRAKHVRREHLRRRHSAQAAGSSPPTATTARRWSGR